MKIINIILGLATAIILGALIHLGIRAFHPEPVSPYDDGIFTRPIPYKEFNCAKGDKECTAEQNQFLAEQQAEQEAMNEKGRIYNEAMRVYNRDVFVIANILGILIFIGGFMMLFKAAIEASSISIGVMVAGLWSIIYGYMRGWDSTNDQLKFFVGLAVAVLVIGGSAWLIQRYVAQKGRNR